MAKRVVCVLAALLLAVSAVPFVSASGVYIGTAEELCALSSRVASGDSMAGMDIYLTASITLKAPFTPIGKDASAPFCGRFHGGGFSIKGLCVNGGDYAGLFGYIYNGSVDGIVLEDALVSGNNYVGLLAGRLYAMEGSAAVKNCTVSGSVTGVSYVGGAVGYCAAAAYGLYALAEISGNSVSASVCGDINVGGVLGKGEVRSTSSRAELYACGNKVGGKVEALGRYGSLAGGICGALFAESDGGRAVVLAGNNVSYAFVSAELSAAGGICGAIGASGYGASSCASDCVSFGTVNSAALSGGICGKSEAEDRADAVVKNCIAAGNVQGGSVYAFSGGIGVSDCVNAESGEISYPDSVNPPSFAEGDADGNGVCDNIDAALILRYDAGLIILGVAAHGACDLNSDGEINNTDAALALKYDAGISD